MSEQFPVEIDMKIVMLRETSSIYGLTHASASNKLDDPFWQEQVEKRRGEMEAALSDLRSAIRDAIERGSRP